jgi:hypothetical protein
VDGAATDDRHVAKGTNESRLSSGKNTKNEIRQFECISFVDVETLVPFIKGSPENFEKHLLSVKKYRFS